MWPFQIAKERGLAADHLSWMPTLQTSILRHHTVRIEET